MTERSEPPQNIYDDPVFFAGYAALRDAERGLNAVLEQPALARLLPSSLMGLRILDLGCGFGDFARAARAQGAASVLGIDVSEKMLAEARRRTSDPAIRYEQAAIEALAVEPGAFDLAVSSLALHYVADYRTAVRTIAAALAPRGRFVFSVEHPMCTAMAVYEWQRDATGAELHWPVDRYGEEGRRDTRWFVDGVVKHHRTVASYVNGLVEAGLALARLEEPEADPAALAARPELALHRRRPPFLLLAADKPA
jgi:SAM-dependent methyltransferase